MTDLIHQEEFLSTYWQSKPLFIKGAFKGVESWLDGNDLAGLACEEEVESRIVQQLNGNWQNLSGPFDDDVFGRLREDSPWSLLVQAVDHWVPEIKLLRDQFRFLPSWRLDDVMVSYSTAGGTVSPHFDYYDVFLIQGQGRRRWQLGEVCNSDTPMVPDSDIKTLVDFEVQQEFEMDPGDLLYVPARFAHYGVSLENSITFSVGYRAPSLKQAVDGVANTIVDALSEDWRYRDTIESLQAKTGQIPTAAIHALKQAVINEITDDVVASWFGKEVSFPKYFEWLEEPVHCDNWKARILGGQVVEPRDSSRFAYYLRNEVVATLYVDGEDYAVPRGFAELLCDRPEAINQELMEWLENTECSEALDTLITSGALFFIEEA